ncbi:uncharacterized protein TNCV_4271401 [Trichonephila clavipes]|nr:uncharacterized protein TNCV_4271401 [Trichonephila clavipes]
MYRVSLNAVYKLGGEVENVLRSHYYIGKDGWKDIGGAVHELASSEHGFPHFRQGQCSMNMNRYTKTKFVDIHFIYDLANGNGRVAIRLHWGRYTTRRQLSHQTFAWVNQNLAEHVSFRAPIDDTPVSSEIYLVT